MSPRVTGPDQADSGPAGQRPVDLRPAGPHAARRRPPRPLLRTMLGEVLRRTRREQGRTLADVAREAQVSLPYLSELERGLKEASSEVLASVCDALGIELSGLLAQAGRELDRETARRERVVRLDTIRAGRAGLAAPPPGPAGHRPAAPTMLAA